MSRVHLVVGIIAIASSAVSIRAAAEAAEGKKRALAQNEVEAWAPAGWRIVTSGLPETVTGAAIGPPGKTGDRPVVIVSRLDRAPTEGDWADARLSEYIGRALKTSALNLSSMKVKSDLGAPDIEIKSAIGIDPLVVRHLIVGQNHEWLITVISPSLELDDTLTYIRRAKTRLLSPRKL